MTFYQELQLSSTGSKQLIKRTTDPKEKRRHILIYNFKVYLVMAFCVAVVTLYSKLTGNANSVVGVTVLLALLVLRQADFGIRTSHGPVLHCWHFWNIDDRTGIGKQGVTIWCIAGKSGLYYAVNDSGMPQCHYVQSLNLCAGISVAFRI